MTFYVVQMDGDDQTLEAIADSVVPIGTVTRYHSEDADSGVNTITLAHEGVPRDRLEEYVARNYPGSHCQHSYDCCGRTYRSAGKLIFANDDTAIVQQRWYVNI